MANSQQRNRETHQWAKLAQHVHERQDRIRHPPLARQPACSAEQGAILFRVTMPPACASRMHSSDRTVCGPPSGHRTLHDALPAGWAISERQLVLWSTTNSHLCPGWQGASPDPAAAATRGPPTAHCTPNVIFPMNASCVPSPRVAGYQPGSGRGDRWSTQTVPFTVNNRSDEPWQRSRAFAAFSTSSCRLNP